MIYNWIVVGIIILLRAITQDPGSGAVSPQIFEEIILKGRKSASEIWMSWVDV